MSDVIVFDFDGVIANTTKECFLTAICAYKKQPHFTRESYLFPSTTEQVETLFGEYRYLVGPANEYYFLIGSIFECINSNNNNIIESFNHYKRNNQVESEDFVEYFFEVREIARSQFFADWLALNPCYRQMPDIVNHCLKEKEVFIASTKDVESIATLLRTYQVSLPRNRIFGKEYGTDKFFQLKEIMNLTGASHRNIAFIDDNLDHLKAVKPLGLKLYLAMWGYNSPTEQKAAKDFGVHLITINELRTELDMK